MPPNTTSVSSAPSGTTTTNAATSTPGVNSEFTFITSESTLAVATMISSTGMSAMTLTDPDQPTTTVLVRPSATTTLQPGPLPSGIPFRIYPSDPLPSNPSFPGFTLISILFNQGLNWPWVVGNQVSSSQIFAYVPMLITTALGVQDSDVKTFALQVYIPMEYTGPADKHMLGTMWLGYIPTDQVNNLAAQIKARQSSFYTAAPSKVALELASYVNPGFSLLSIKDPSTGGTNSDGGSASNSSHSSSQARQDAIIGVVSALGAIALLVLVFLVYRSVVRRREMAHRRLSDPAPSGTGAGVPPAGSRQFDQDSVGGARRRSFYYAEDSLRGYQAEREEVTYYSSGMGSSGMTQRTRTAVVPGAISAPILRESSMNW
ncbi:hypothetical protein AMATHDRAFT_137776 [Amanita thiersii Skay4041]|uniref:Uncharacterized protein n=1 Tax=Amanita thiersii Skay4041 TaxID=703135 RepID=A0A2A9NT76_9AGAR|nr:hypothetical protein AMATHDRAFT_137776 [Amanita thiersii Skay4041]